VAYFLGHPVCVRYIAN